jgi:hypothetical protein
MTTTAPDVLVVHEHVARNPIARAVARGRLEQAARTFAIRLYMLQDGEDVAADAYAAARSIYLGHLVASQAGRGDDADARVMHGALSTLKALAERGWRWHVADAVPVDVGLQRALEELRTATAQQMRRAWDAMDESDRQSAPRATATGAAC